MKSLRLIVMVFCVCGKLVATEVKTAGWGPDIAGQELLAAARDPNFDSVAGRFPMLQLPREALGVPEGRDEFVLLADGSIQVSNARMHVPPENRAVLYFLLGQNKQRFGQGIAPDAKRLADGYLPLVSTPFTHDGLPYEQSIFAWTENMARDPEARLWAYVELSLKNPGDHKRSMPVVCQVDCGLPPISIQAGQWNVELVCCRFCRRHKAG